MRLKEPDILLLPVLLPLFILGSIPLLLLAFLGYAGLGLAGLLMLLGAQRDESDAKDDFAHHAIADGVWRASDRAMQRRDVLAAHRLAQTLRVAGTTAIIGGVAGLFYS